jgi:hypothetical protein
MVHRQDIIIAASLFLAAFAIYALTAAPTFVFADTAELALAASTGGVAHPPGFPLYLILAGIWSHLPLGSDIAYRLNLFSGLAGALCIPGIYLALRIAVDRRIPAIAAALLFAFSLTFWQQATITEVYTLNMLMTSLVILFAILHLRLASEKRPRLWVPAAIGLMAGLGVANHLTIGLFLFGIALMVTLAPRKRGRWLKDLLPQAGTGFAFFFLGLLTYAVLPIRASGTPPINWGDPDLWDPFLRHIRGWQFHVYFKMTPETAGKQMLFFVQRLPQEMGILPLFLVPAGCEHLWRTNRRLLAGLAVCFFLPFLWTLGYDIAEDQETYFLIPFLILAILMGSGAVWAIRLRPWIAYVILALAISPLVLNFPEADRRQEREAESYARDILEEVEEDAIILTRYWNWYAPTMYLQHIENVRRDVDVVDLNLLKYSWYVPYLKSFAPRIFIGLEKELQRFRPMQVRWEDGKLPPEVEGDLHMRYEALCFGFVRQAWKSGRPVYATFETAVEIEKEFRGDPFTAVPETLAFRLLPHARPVSLPGIILRNTWERKSRDRVAWGVMEKYEVFWRKRGEYLQAVRQPEAAVEAFRHAENLLRMLEKDEEASPPPGRSPGRPRRD